MQCLGFVGHPGCTSSVLLWLNMDWIGEGTTDFKEFFLVIKLFYILLNRTHAHSRRERALGRGDREKAKI